MWSTSVFSSYLIVFQLKYLKGNIFQNTNSYAISYALSKIFGGAIYSKYGLKKSLISSYLISLAGGSCIFLIQSKIIDILPFFAPLNMHF